MKKSTKKFAILLAFVACCLLGGKGYAFEPVVVNMRTQTTFEDLQSAVSASEVRAGDTLKLLKEIDEVSEFSTQSVTSFTGIDLSKDITLDGAGYEIKRPRDYLGTLFSIAWGTNITFSGMVIDGQAPGWYLNFDWLPTAGYVVVPLIAWSNDIEAKGSLILNGGNLNFVGSTLKNILVSKVNGAGIRTLKNSRLTVEKSDFRHIAGKTGSSGWAIAADAGAKLIVRDSVFENTVVVWGHYVWGSIFVWGGVDDQLAEIENSEFRQAHAMNGGALYITASAIKISGSKFIENTSGNDGSAIQFSTTNNSSLNDTTTLIEDTLFSGNIGLSKDNQSMGTIVFGTYHGKLTHFLNCEFRANSNSAGGVIADFWSTKTNVLFEKSIFTQNDAAGGVIYAQNIDTTIKDSIITWNISSKWNPSVAGIYYTSSLVLENTLIENNGHSTWKVDYTTIQLWPGTNSGHTQLIIKEGTVIRNNISRYGAIASTWKQNISNAKSTIHMASGAKLYDNVGLSWGSDFYFFRDTSAKLSSTYDIKIQPATSMDVKDARWEAIIGWFSDRSSKRYSPFDYVENPQPLVVWVDGVLTYNGIANTAFALKAAALDNSNPILQQLDTQKVRRNAPIAITFTGGDNLKIASVSSIQPLPQGLELLETRLSDTGRNLMLSGVISKAWTYPLGFLITDALGNTGSMSFELKITKPLDPSWVTSETASSDGEYGSALQEQKQEEQKIDSKPDEKKDDKEEANSELKSDEQKKEEKSDLLPQSPVNDDTKIIYSDDEIYNPSIENGKCYNRRTYLGIKDSEKLTTSKEFKKALSFLRSYEMTMFDEVDGFDPYRNLTREEAAKIFSNFAINVLCRKPDLNLHTNYSDIQNVDPTLKPYIEMAYQLGVMKGSKHGDGKFRPKDAISKAEVNAILIRMILKSYLDENIADGTSRYSAYNQVAKSLGIISQEAGLEPLSRNEVALMLFRAYKNQVFDWQNVDYWTYVLESRETFVK